MKSQQRFPKKKEIVATQHISDITYYLLNNMTFTFIPMISAAQYQQSWAYGNNVNLLAANTNLPTLDCTGSGIFSGRSGALDVFVSEQPATKILLAKVPTNLSPRLPKSEGLADFSTENRLKMYSQIHQDLEPNINEFSRPDKMWNKPNFPEILQPFGSDEMKLWQENLTDFTVEFLDFSQNLTQSGSVCNYNVCCHYDIEVSDSSQREELVSFDTFLLCNKLYRVCKRLSFRRATKSGAYRNEFQFENDFSHRIITRYLF